MFRDHPSGAQSCLAGGVFLFLHYPHHVYTRVKPTFDHFFDTIAVRFGTSDAYRPPSSPSSLVSALRNEHHTGSGKLHIVERYEMVPFPYQDKTSGYMHPDFEAQVA